MKASFIILVLLFFSSISSAQIEPIILRGPALNSDGSKIAFSYQGDIWVCNSTGGKANRLTIHEAYEGSPQWSPNNDKIAFVSNRHGNNDVFTINPDGANLHRLNYHSASDSWPRWTTKNSLTFTTTRNFVHVERSYEIHSIPSSGGTPHRILDAVGEMATTSPNGRFVAFVRGICRITREAYQGPAQRDIWIYDELDKSYTKISSSPAMDIKPDFGSNTDLYYLSAESGRYNIHHLQLDINNKSVTKSKQITHHKKEGIRNFDVSADGKSIVYEHGTDIYYLVIGKKAKKLNISVSNDYRFYPSEKKKLNGNISDYALSPDEKYLAFVAKGEVFIKKNDTDKTESINISNHAFREIGTAWLNDTTLLYLSDRAGNFDLYLSESSDTLQMDLFKTFKRNTRRLTNSVADETNFVLSPDRKKICLTVARGKLHVYDIDENGNLSNEKILLDGWDSPRDISWSPDGEWLAYSLMDLNFNMEVFIHAADGSKEPVNISLHPRYDYDPVWSKDGSKLGFLSIRNYGDADVWFVWLSKKDWEKSKKDWEEDEDQETPKKKKGMSENEEDKDSTNQKELITIDFEDIHKRLQQVTRLPGNENNLQIDHEGEVFYFTTNSSGRTSSGGARELKSIKWDGKEEKTILSNGNITGLKWDEKGKYLYGIQKGKLAKIKVDGAKLEKLPHMAKMNVDRQKEREQIFNELWRTLRDGFYDPQFHGQDFERLKDKYYERAIHASTTQDFRSMVNEMLGQLNASHMGLYQTPNPEKTQKDYTGKIGVELKPVGTGVEITHIISGGPADKERSKLYIGDVITHVNNTPITAKRNFYQFLDDAREEKILLNITSKNGDSREVIIRPTSSLIANLYDEWIDKRKKLTEEYSNGRLGYIHIKAMGWAEFERFERELMASGYGKEGIVIDVRFNSGGWTADMVLAVIDVRQHAYTIPRGATKSLKNHKDFSDFYAFGERLPLSWWTKPSIAMCNEASYSNGEILSHAYKSLGLGTLVGQPTFGAVISTGARTLMDGSYVRLPFRGWYVKATKENMELGPAVPHILVQNPPDAKSKGEDPQLKRAVDELLKQIDN